MKTLRYNVIQPEIVVFVCYALDFIEIVIKISKNVVHKEISHQTTIYKTRLYVVYFVTNVRKFYCSLFNYIHMFKNENQFFTKVVIEMRQSICIVYLN